MCAQTGGIDLWDAVFADIGAGGIRNSIMVERTFRDAHLMLVRWTWCKVIDIRPGTGNLFEGFTGCPACVGGYSSLPRLRIVDMLHRPAKP